MDNVDANNPHSVNATKPIAGLHCFTQVLSKDGPSFSSTLDQHAKCAATASIDQSPKFHAKSDGNKRVVSLWDMLKLETEFLMSAISMLAYSLGEYRTQHTVLQSGVLAFQSQPILDKAHVITAIKRVKKYSKRMKLKASRKLAGQTLDYCMEQFSSNIPADLHQLNRLIVQIDSLLNTFVAEASSREFLLVDNFIAKYDDDADGLFGKDIVDAFPNAEYDIEEAGQCLYFERWTAAVFHSMRIYEIGLHELARHLEIPAHENWNQTLNQIEAELRAKNKKEFGAEGEIWAAEAGTYLRFVKNAQRNPTMHATKTYDKRKAIKIFEDAKTFMQHLTQELS